MIQQLVILFTNYFSIYGILLLLKQFIIIYQIKIFMKAQLLYHNNTLEIIKELGRGTYGTVYLAKIKNTEIFYAIKQFFCPDQKTKMMIIKQFEIAKNLSHPGVVHTYDLIRQGQKYYLVMQYCEGSLFNYIGKKLDDKTIIYYFKQIIETMIFMHEDKSTIHRDLKAQNILIKKDKIKISDFGVSKHAENIEQMINQTNTGTPHYVSPQILFGQPYSKKCDNFSLGVLLYELCYSQKPFESANSIFMLHKFYKSLQKQPIVFPESPPIRSQLKKIMAGLLQFSEQKRMELAVVDHELTQLQKIIKMENLSSSTLSSSKQIKQMTSIKTPIKIKMKTVKIQTPKQQSIVQEEKPKKGIIKIKMKQNTENFK